MRLQKRKGTVDGYEWRCRKQSKDNRHDVVRSENPEEDLWTSKNDHSSRVVKASNCGWPCHEFESSTTKDSSCRGALHVKSVKSSNVLPLVW
ncbi:hypothetical protein TNCV_837131 [Trichonephila clavipes]|nr:hypothetical protein TNCV_837131 [Trichonephila clavipes]